METSTQAHTAGKGFTFFFAQQRLTQTSPRCNLPPKSSIVSATTLTLFTALRRGIPTLTATA